MTEIMVAVLSGILGGGLATALLSHWLNRGKTAVEMRQSEAMIRQTEAMTRNLDAMTTKIAGELTQVKSEQQGQQRTIDEIQEFMLRHFITQDERSHLERLAGKAHWPFQEDASTPFFLNELRNLRAMGLIEGKPGKGVRSLRREKGNVNDHFQIRPEGEAYLNLIKSAEEKNTDKSGRP